MCEKISRRYIRMHLRAKLLPMAVWDSFELLWPIIESEFKNDDGSGELKSQLRFLGDYAGFMAPPIRNFEMMIAIGDSTHKFLCNGEKCRVVNFRVSVICFGFNVMSQR